MGRGGAAYGSSSSLRSQDRASDGGMGGAASTSGFSGFEDATEGRTCLNGPQSICALYEHLSSFGRATKVQALVVFKQPLRSRHLKLGTHLGCGCKHLLCDALRGRIHVCH